ncbi:hypothetical protein [Polyangium aurulentum]|uniref:monooxygenase n=1 Tax=Polyangium aurulentum TaxID=2567896 RepID=UPI0010AE7B3F|nr:hypothetical protein [Polyangium aurulentum]UQA60592.1 hypothetical protein E8A73_009005 [Polyangium aurulentum]
MRPHLAMSSLVALGCIVGCGSSGDSGSSDGPSSSTEEPTYYKDIAPLVNKECTSCHHDGGIAPFSLSDAATAAKMAGAMAAATQSRTMPPMPVNNDESCNTYKNARWLSDEEIALFERWSKAGAPLGDPKDAPLPPVDETPKLTGELESFDMGVDYTPQPPPGELDEYRCFIVDPGITEDTFITGYDIQPGDPRVVHHVSLFYLNDAQADADAEALDAADPGPGYRCFGAAGVQSSVLYGVWVPGSGATILPEGTGIFHGAGRKIALQVHYNVPLMGGPFTDRSKVTYQVAKDPTLTRAYLMPVGSFQFSLPPKDDKANVTADVPLDQLGWFISGVDASGGIRIWGAMPHMHVIGRTQRTTLKQQGAEECVTDVDRWNFHWQDMWWYETPIDVAPGSTLSISCDFDTRGRTTPTTWGEGTNDEMCTNILYATLAGK